MENLTSGSEQLIQNTESKSNTEIETSRLPVPYSIRCFKRRVHLLIVIGVLCLVLILLPFLGNPGRFLGAKTSFLIPSRDDDPEHVGAYASISSK